MNALKIYWVCCSCQNVNRFSNDQLLVFTSENKKQNIGTDSCAKCGIEHTFDLELKILAQMDKE